MPAESFLHERGDFKALVETVAASERITDPALVEKDYWIMHAVFGLKQIGLAFELKGGTSLSKGFGMFRRRDSDMVGHSLTIEQRKSPVTPRHSVFPYQIKSRTLLCAALVSCFAI
jgi:hypothetical protein